MLELKVEIRDVEVEDMGKSYNIDVPAFVPDKKKGYKGAAKMVWNLIKKNPGHHLWINTNVYAKRGHRWIYFMTFDDKLYPQPGSCFCRKDFSTRKRVQAYLRHLRKCQRRALLKEEVPERLGITEDIHITFSH